MSIVNYHFGYPGALSVPVYASAENLKMSSGVSTPDGYLLPRGYTVNSVMVTWSAASVGDSVMVDVMSGATQLESIIILAADEDTKYKTASPAYTLGANAYLNVICYGVLENTITDLNVVLELSTSGAAGDPDDVLPNISIGTSDLQTVKPNITQYLKDGEYDFDDIVLNQKRELYGLIKAAERVNFPSYTNAELDTLLATIRDYPKEGNLANRLKNMVVGWILMDNRLYDEAGYYITHAKSIPLQYYIDDDASQTAESAEMSYTYAPRFGR